MEKCISMAMLQRATLASCSQRFLVLEIRPSKRAHSKTWLLLCLCFGTVAPLGFQKALWINEVKFNQIELIKFGKHFSINGLGLTTLTDYIFFSSAHHLFLPRTIQAAQGVLQHRGERERERGSPRCSSTKTIIWRNTSICLFLYASYDSRVATPLAPYSLSFLSFSLFSPYTDAGLLHTLCQEKLLDLTYTQLA